MNDREKRDILDILAAVFSPGERAKIKHTGDLVEIVGYYGDWDYEIKYLDPLLNEIFSAYPDTIVASGKNLIPVEEDHEEPE